MKNYDIAVIGGGASGMACAVKLAESGKNLNIAIVEGGERLGKKLAATGNGQGNISNTDMGAGHYFGGNITLAESIACKDAYAGASLFGFMFSADERGRIYPAGRQASSLGDCLIRKLSRYGADIIKAKAERLQKGFIITLSNGEKIKADYVALCVGGKAQKQFLTDGSSYKLALDFGHKLTPLYPSLVQLKTETEHIKQLKGIRTDCLVSAFSGGKLFKKTRGDVIFTDYGVSGNAVFFLSAYLADKPQGSISLEFLPDFSAEDIERNISDRLKGGTPVQELLSGTLHNTVGRAIIKRSNSDNPKKIVETLKNFTLRVTGTLGFDYAQVTRGGIDMSDISDELESKLVKNLFFAGEVLDIDGECGGYNLQWAFTSGMEAAKNILKRIEK